MFNGMIRVKAIEMWAPPGFNEPIVEAVEPIVDPVPTTPTPVDQCPVPVNLSLKRATDRLFGTLDL